MPADDRLTPDEDASTPTRRPYLRADDRRNQLLEAAAAVYRRQGFPGLTMVAVAEEAKVSRRLLYNHFPDLESLITGLIFHKLGSYLATSEGEFNEPNRPLRSVGRSIFDRIGDMGVDNRHLVMDILNERRSPELLNIRQLAISTILARWSKLLPDNATVHLDRARITVLAHLALILNDLVDRGELTLDEADSILPSLFGLAETLGTTARPA